MTCTTLRNVYKPYQEVTCNPDDLLFTKPVINIRFRPPHDKLHLDDAVRLLETNALNARSFPKIRVVEYDEKLWCLDNRRLWVFRIAPRVKQVTVVVVPVAKKFMRFLTEVSPTKYQRMMQPKFFPKVKWCNNQQENLGIWKAINRLIMRPDNKAVIGGVKNGGTVTILN